MNNTCQIEGCEAVGYCRGLCQRHYARWKRHGDPLAGRGVRGAAPRYFRETVVPFEGDECLLWPFGQFSTGYGLISVDGNPRGVHREACEARHGSPPSDAYEAAHNCGNPLCCNPAHLRWALPKQNKADEVSHGTRREGETHTNSKVTAGEVIEIRRLAAAGGLTQAQIGARFGLDQTQISNIIRRKQWASVP